MFFSRDKAPWYSGGLRFACRQCGRCCSGPPGYVWVTREERAALAQLLGVDVEDFERDYCRRVLTRVSLREHANGDCYLLKDGRCIAYPVRPRQCRTWPFWKEVLASPADWERASGRCPGVGQGRLYTRGDIEEIRSGKRDT